MYNEIKCLRFYFVTFCVLHCCKQDFYISPQPALDFGAIAISFLSGNSLFIDVLLSIQGLKVTVTIIGSIKKFNYFHCHLYFLPPMNGLINFCKESCFAHNQYCKK